MASPIGGGFIASPKIVRSVIDITESNDNVIGLDDFGSAKLILSGNITELVVMKRENSVPSIKKLDADRYVYLPTGDIREYQRSETRLDNLKSVRQTISELRRIINTNVINADECKWVTLTYAENMTDRERLMKDFQKFWQRLLRWCKRSSVPDPEYISVIEPQARGAWHCHLILVWQQKAPFIPNDVIASLWGQGFTKTKALNDVDNIGAYFSAYLADMPLDELEKMTEDEASFLLSQCEVSEKTFVSDDKSVKRKKFVKGARLHLYPPGMKLYRCSRGIEKPTQMKLPYDAYKDLVDTYSRQKKKASYGELTFSTSTVVMTDYRIVNHIDRFYFNTNSKLNGEYEK